MPIPWPASYTKTRWPDGRKPVDELASAVLGGSAEPPMNVRELPILNGSSEAPLGAELAESGLRVRGC